MAPNPAGMVDHVRLSNVYRLINQLFIDRACGSQAPSEYCE